MEKEKTEKRGNKLVNVIAGSVLGAAAFLVSGCDYMLSYSTYDPFYPRTYYGYRTIEPFSHPYYSYPSYRSPRYINPPSHRYSPSRPPIIRPSLPSIRPSPSRPPIIRPSLPSIRPSPPTIRSSPNSPSRPNIPNRGRR